MSWRVRSRRLTCHSRVPVRAFTASSRCRMTVRRRVIRRAAISSRCSFAWPALKEARACLAPALLRACIFRSCRAEQRASENVGIECIGARRNDEFAELAYTAFLKGLRFRFERLQLRIEDRKRVVWGKGVAVSGARG